MVLHQSFNNKHNLPLLSAVVFVLISGHYLVLLFFLWKTLFHGFMLSPEESL